MSYADIGFNDSLSIVFSEDQPQQLDALQVDTFLPEISGSKLNGLLQSKDGKVKVDLDNNTIIISDGVTNRVVLGKQSDDSYGLLIKDINGNVLMQITGNTNLIQSPTRTFKIDLTAEQLQVFEAPEGIMRILLGRQTGGF